MKNVLLIVFTLLLTACTSTTPQYKNKISTDKSNITVSNTVERKEPTFKQKVYYFQHKILPDWVHNTKGDFYFDLMGGDVSQLKRAAAEVISLDYSEAIQVIPYEKSSAVLFIFPEPKSTTNCFFSLLKKEGDSYIYSTYEKTLKLGEDDIVGVVGQWNKEGAHSNFGARTYSDADSFVEEMLQAK